MFAYVEVELNLVENVIENGWKKGDALFILATHPHYLQMNEKCVQQDAPKS